MADEAILYSERTPEDGVIRLSKWPEGYVLWHHGEIVWRSWINKTEKLTLSVSLDTSSVQGLLDRVKDQIVAMTPAEREEMHSRQRESFARGMATPCEHGILDFEQCPECRAFASKPEGREQ